MPWNVTNKHRSNNHLEKAEMNERNQKTTKKKEKPGSREIGERETLKVYKEREYLKKWGFAHV